MNLDLGGPGPGCSAMRVRRFAAGELSGAEKDRTAAHVAGCARCAATQREIALEQEELRRDVPFPQFAAGVAERLAHKPRQTFVARWAPLAAAAGLALIAGVQVLRAPDDAGIRSKGAASAQIFVQDPRGVHELGLAPVSEGARLLVSLHPAGRKNASVVLIESGEISVIYAGAAVNGPLPQAFEWTGSRAATLKIVFADRPIDPAKPPRDADVIELPLHR